MHITDDNCSDTIFSYSWAWNGMCSPVWVCTGSENSKHSGFLKAAWLNSVRATKHTALRHGKNCTIRQKEDKSCKYVLTLKCISSESMTGWKKMNLIDAQLKEWSDVCV